MVHFWLRHEVKPFECRTIILPDHAEKLMAAGHKVTVERSPTRCSPDEGYEKVGCTMVDTETWPTAPEDAVIVGLKELPNDGEADAMPLKHSHIYFAHCYKDQDNWEHVLNRFVKGHGTLWDIEFLTNEQYRRVAGFSKIAGMVGMAVGALGLAHQKLHPNIPMPKLENYDTFEDMINDVKGQLAKAGIPHPRVLVMGALGRSGGGAVQVARDCGIPEDNISKWDLEETKAGGPFPEILEHDIFVNCILLTKKVAPFLTTELCQKPGRTLRVVSDVSCDPNNPNNPIPIYDKITTMKEPMRRLLEADGANPPMDVTAIDHLPSLCSLAASREVGDDMLPHMLAYNTSTPWVHTLEKFNEKVKDLPK